MIPTRRCSYSYAPVQRFPRAGAVLTDALVQWLPISRCSSYHRVVPIRMNTVRDIAPVALTRPKAARSATARRSFERVAIATESNCAIRWGDRMNDLFTSEQATTAGNATVVVDLGGRAELRLILIEGRVLIGRSWTDDPMIQVPALLIPVEAVPALREALASLEAEK
jgi:hypothetical protein